MMTRREFIERSCAGAAVAGLAADGERMHARTAAARWKIIAFSKPFTTLNFNDTADLVADVGWDGIECPVRKAQTHIQPERVDEDLPKMVEALKKRGREVAMITTDITGVDASAQRILKTAVALGIRKYRLCPIRYVATKAIADQHVTITLRIRVI